MNTNNTTTTTTTTTTIFIATFILSALIGKEACVDNSHKNATFIVWNSISKQLVFCTL
jgi:hypothetical protein